MNIIKKVLVAMGLVIAAQGVAQAALITSWNYTLNTQFTSATYINGATTTAPVPSVNIPPGTSTTALLLSWGIPNSAAGQSSLGISNPAAGTIATTTDPAAPFVAPGSILTHNNRPIFAPYLTAMHMQATLTLTTLTPPPVGIPAPGLVPLTFDVAFVETPNNTNAGPCAVASSPTPCNDIFALVGTPNLNQTFTLDGILYTVRVFPAVAGVLNTLPDAVCVAAGQPIGCTGFTTPENAATNLPFAFTVSATQDVEPVPEPGSLALMGLGLMGFAAARRKRNNA